MEETMRVRLLTHAPLRAVFAGAAALALTGSPAPAQQVTSQPVSTAGPGCLPPPPSCATPAAPAPGAPPSPFVQPTPAPAEGTLTSDLALGGGLSAAAGAESVALDAAGYIDDAIPQTRFRLRFDAAYNDNRPDRAEFFYGKCGCFKIAGVDPRAPGPPLTESRVDYQELSSYLEYAVGQRFSGFVEIPVRFINPEQNANFTGLGDINFGAKLAMISQQDTVLTFQFRTYVPSGDAFKGLGNDHVSLEPALLLYQRLGDRLALQGEFRDWIPIDGTDFAGNVIRYGVGLDYLVFNRPNFRVILVPELVGWTVLGGKEAAVANAEAGILQVQDASGDTIVNAKFGVRIGFGALEERGLLSSSDLYVGYGRALTGDVWYKDILRVEYRLHF
jgi:hypothetical protein